MPSLLSGRLVLLLAALLTVLGSTQAVQVCIQSEDCMNMFAEKAAVVGHVLDEYCRMVQKALQCLRDNEGNCKTEEERLYNQKQITEVIKRHGTSCDGMLWRSSKLMVLVIMVASWWLQRP